MAWSFADMFNIAAGAGVIALLTTAGLVGPTNLGIDPITTASTSDDKQAAENKGSVRDYDRFMVIDHSGRGTCLFALFRAEGYDVHRVEPGASCGTVAKRLPSARIWSEDAQGTVTIADRDGLPVMRLAPSDGLAYEVIEPANMALSLEAF